MPKRIVNSPVTIARDGKPVYPEVGKVFDFTDAETASLNGANPKALGKIITADPVKAAQVKPVEPTKA